MSDSYTTGEKILGVTFLIILFLGLAWGFDFVVVRYILIPSVSALIHWVNPSLVSYRLPFWPTMGLFYVVSVIFSKIQIPTKEK